MHTYIHIHIYIFMYITKRKARKNGQRGVKKRKRERDRKREREEKRERESRTPERDENIRRGAPRYHHPSTLVLLPPPIYHPTSHNGSNPRTGFLLHLSSAGRLDAAARCVGGFNTRLRSYFQNSVYILKLSFFLSLSLPNLSCLGNCHSSLVSPFFNRRSSHPRAALINLLENSRWDPPTRVSDFSLPL